MLSRVYLAAHMLHIRKYTQAYAKETAPIFHASSRCLGDLSAWCTHSHSSVQAGLSCTRQFMRELQHAKQLVWLAPPYSWSRFQKSPTPQCLKKANLLKVIFFKIQDERRHVGRMPAGTPACKAQRRSQVPALQKPKALPPVPIRGSYTHPLWDDTHDPPLPRSYL